MVVQDHRIGGGLDVQQHLLPAGRRGRDPHPLVLRVQALHRGAVRAVDQALALEARHVGVEAQVDQRLDGAPRPGLGHRARHRDPAGAPRRAPGVADRDRGARRGQALGDRDGLAGGRPDADLQRDGLGVHGRADALLQDALEAGLDQGAVIVHVSGLRCVAEGCMTEGVAERGGWGAWLRRAWTAERARENVRPRGGPPR